MSEAEDIVRALAEGREPYNCNDTAACNLCLVDIEIGPHADSCPYRRAVEWVARNPEAKP